LVSRLKGVDYVYIFDEKTFADTLRELQPKMYAKGRDYTLATINQEERQIIEGYGGEIVIVDHPVDITTTQIFKKLADSIKVVNAIVKHPQDTKFLVIKRKDGIHAGKWAFPGGIVNDRESSEEALRRELKEEVGLDLKNVVKKISNYSYTRPDNTQTEGECYLADVTHFNVKINSEAEEFRWVTLEEFEKLDHIEGLDGEALIAFS